MKKYILMIMALLCVSCITGCTLNYEEPPSEKPSEDHSQVEEETEKEELIPLLAADEESDLYLYGIRPDGVILYNDGTGHYYDWAYSCAQYRQPRLFTGDFDGNNTQDIAIVTYTKNDGVSVEDLRIIKDGNYDEEYIFKVDEDDFNSAVRNIVTHYFANDAVTFTVDSVNFSFDLSDCFEKLVYDGVSYNENVEYEFADGEIYVKIIPTVRSGDGINDYGKVNLDITLKAKLNFDGYNISLSEPELIPHI
ncbi:MAG: hypothetical protein IKW03_06950 [Clostridia bacterium]|nr:hypothetical protein [Clostridia bacterium]